MRMHILKQAVNPAARKIGNPDECIPSKMKSFSKDVAFALEKSLCVLQLLGTSLKRMPIS